MSERFKNLTKIPDAPVARLLAAGNAKLKTELDAPPSAKVGDVLAELEAKQAWVDMIRLLSVALPPREGVWWACLAGRQILGEKGKSACLDAAEAWVFEPNDENREKIQSVLENEASGDKTAHCATAALYAPGNLGPGDLSSMQAPPGIVSACIFGVNLKSLKCQKDVNAQFRLIIDRGLDIARGGNGNVEPDDAPAEQGAG